MRFEIRHPDIETMKAAYGHDRAIGWWIEVRDGGRLLESHDALDPGGTTPASVMGVFTKHGFFTLDDVSAAADEMQAALAEEIEDQAIRTAATVIINLRQAAG